MKLWYKTIFMDGNSTNYKLVNDVVFCCGRMKESFRRDPCGKTEITFSCMEGFAPFEPTVQVINRVGGWDGVEYEPFSINYCPFCGTHIDCVEAKQVKIIKKEKVVVQTVNRVVEEEEEVPV